MGLQAAEESVVNTLVAGLRKLDLNVVHEATESYSRFITSHFFVR
jgi:hypothetical protein